MNEKKQPSTGEYDKSTPIYDWNIDSEVSDTDSYRAAIEGSLKVKGWNEDEADKIGLGFKELLDNAIKHGNKNTPGKKVSVKIKITPTKFEGEIQDEGKDSKAFWENLPDPTADENLLKSSGRGILMARAWMNEVKFEKNKQGVKVVFVRDLNQPLNSK
ncbi:MAG: ATP-binding protein [Candidatus Doudnabacteria bacterium]|nr:ATP-binding protein [Candidatus Doudnabacteria bacterium]